jgi:hypothetical protein
MSRKAPAQGLQSHASTSKLAARFKFEQTCSHDARMEHPLGRTDHVYIRAELFKNCLIFVALEAMQFNLRAKGR